tara:strand:- start:1622 stop:1918 length:297 start_codon:yes stop_codon:yes gene_type:complete
MADVHIYRPSKTATQSGLAGVRAWILEFEPVSGKFIDPLMGWTGSSDTLQQVRLKFGSESEAIAFAKAKGWTYRLSIPEVRSRKIKSYADNFRYKKIS